MEARDRDVREPVEVRPLLGMALEVRAVGAERLEAELARTAADAPAHLAAHLAVAGPATTHPRQRPLQERDAVLAARRGAGHARRRRTCSAPATSARSFASASSRGRYFIPQSGATCRRSGGDVLERRLDAARRPPRPSRPRGSERSSTPRMTVLSADLARGRTRSSRGWADSIAIWSTRAVVELGEEGVARRPVVDDVGVAEARVQRGRPVDALDRAVDGRRRRTRAPASARAWSHGSSIWTTSAPAANRSWISSLTAAARSSARLGGVRRRPR